MSQDDLNLTQWIPGLKAGEDAAARRIWDEFFHRVVGLARKKMGALPARARDEEDLALSAINALCHGAREGRFRQLENSDDLWQLLAMLTSRKAANAWRKQRSQKELGESVLSHNGDFASSAGIDQIVSGRPTEEFAESLSAKCEELLSVLEPKLRDVALARLEGYSNEEIATQQNRSVKTIERYMKMIRSKWTRGEES